MLGDPPLGSSQRRTLQVQQVSPRRPLPAAPGHGGSQAVAGDVQRQPAQPGVQGLRVAQLVQFAVGAPQRLLQDILRLLPVAEDGRGQQEQPIAAWRDQLLEGMVVALAGQQEVGTRGVLRGHPEPPSHTETKPDGPR